MYSFKERSGHVVGGARMTHTNQNILLSYVNTNAFISARRLWASRDM